MDLHIATRPDGSGWLWLRIGMVVCFTLACCLLVASLAIGHLDAPIGTGALPTVTTFA